MVSLLVWVASGQPAAGVSPSHAVSSAKKQHKNNSDNVASMYVDPSDLRPLDVILSRERSKPSKLIAHAVLGIYAHAAIMVNSVELFEATPSGVAIRPFKVDFDRDPHSSYGGEVLEVLRHSLLSELSHTRCKQLAAELAVVCAELSGKR